ncbi:MAG: RNA-processing protein [Candidatus Aenigmatarchaeota archaeon]|nr:MAG: RNA-processing protein [Candidatus Aenigmarchaeota archaeon]
MIKFITPNETALRVEIMIDTAKIPEQRKGVLIGKGGSVKEEIESKTKTKISIDDAVEIEGEPLDVMKAKEIVRAIGRGFSPEKAFRLLNEEFRLIVISLGQETGKRMRRMFSRVIGREGKCKKKIELRTKTDICIYGKTISIIGEWQDVEKAEEVIELLIEGKPHSYVYKHLGEIT